LSSVYLKAPEKFVKKLRDVLNSKVQDRAEDEYYGEELMEGD
jgi:AP-2 complex subunit beta-1/AP-1 complex subunit beta-1